MSHVHDWLPAKTVWGDSVRCCVCGIQVANSRAYEAKEASERVVVARAERVRKMYEGMDVPVTVKRMGVM